jgi:hypothetical protein
MTSQIEQQTLKSHHGFGTTDSENQIADLERQVWHVGFGTSDLERQIWNVGFEHRSWDVGFGTSDWARGFGTSDLERPI